MATTGSTDNRKAQLDITADASQAQAAFAGVKASGKDMAQSVSASAGQAAQAVDKMGDTAAPAAQKVDRATANMVASLQRATAAAQAGGRGTAAYFETIAQQRGISTATIQPYIDGLKAAEAAQAAATKGLGNMGVSAAQTAAALRGVPAQFTDIVTSLQGGQSPLTVLFQQGGQLKDMFGGIGPAVKSLGGYVMGLVNPYTVAAAAAAAFGIAAYQGSQEALAFQRALIGTGNVAGTTAGQLQAMAAQLGSAWGVTQGAASEALVALVNAGATNRNQLEAQAGAILAYSKATGQSVDDLAKSFVALGKDPLAASLKLNESMGYLTVSTYEQIKSLQEQGRYTEAVTLAQKTYADAMDSSASRMTEQLGFMESAWMSLKKVASETWDAMLGVGRTDGLDVQLQKANEEMDKLRRNRTDAANSGVNASVSKLRTDPIDKEIAAQQAVIDTLRESARMGARAAESKAQELRLVKDKTEFDKASLSYSTAQQKAQREINEQTERNNRLLAAGIITQGQADQLNAAIRAKNKGPAAPKLQGAQTSYELSDIKRSLGMETDAYSNQLRVLEAMRSAGIASEREYFDTKTALQSLTGDAQEAAFEKELTYLRGLKLSGKDKIDNDRKIIDTETEMAKWRAKNAADLEVASIQQNSLLEQQKRAFMEATKAAEDYYQTSQRGYDRTLASIGMGDVARSMAGGKNQIEDKYAQQRQRVEDKFTLSKDKSPEARAQYEQELALIEEYRTKSLAQYGTYYERLQAEQGNWVNGATRSMANYLDSVTNVAASTEQIFTKAFRGMEDALVDFVKTGQLDFSRLADSIISDMIRMMVQRQVMGPLMASMGGGGGGGFEVGNGVFNVIDALFNATGNAFAPAGHVEAYAKGGTFTNRLFTTPTPFAFGGSFGAKRLGVMGEAGPEAVMPLHRGPDGVLGVRGTGQQGAAGNVVVNIIESDKGGGQVQQRQEGGTTIIDVVVARVKSEVAQDIVEGRGDVTAAMQGTFGLNRSISAA
jgi:lambda family phage tail tape measure protein